MFLVDVVLLWFALFCFVLPELFVVFFWGEGMGKNLKQQFICVNLRHSVSICVILYRFASFCIDLRQSVCVNRHKICIHLYRSVTVYVYLYQSELICVNSICANSSQ